MSGGFMVFVEYFFTLQSYTLKLLVTRNFINYRLFDDLRYLCLSEGHDNLGCQQKIQKVVKKQH